MLYRVKEKRKKNATTEIVSPHFIVNIDTCE